MDEFDLTRRVLGRAEDDPAGLERARRRLEEAIAAEQRSRRPRRWTRVLPIAAAFVALAAVLVTVLVPAGREAAAAELRRLGAIASSQPALRPGPGEFLLMRSEELRVEGRTHLDSGISYDLISRLRIFTWVAPDRSGFRRTDVLSSDFASEADRLAWVDAGSPDLALPREETYGPGEAPVHDATRVPAEPDRLLSALRSGAIAERPPGDHGVYLLIGELLAQGDASSEVRSALFEVAARLEGVELVGEVEDPLGRPGVAIAIDGPSSRTQLVFDPDSARILAIELYTLGGGASPEEPMSWTALRPTIVVDDSPIADD